MISWDKFFDRALRSAIREAMDEPVGDCPAHGLITRAEDHVFGGCKKCLLENTQPKTGAE